MGWVALEAWNEANVFVARFTHAQIVLASRHALCVLVAIVVLARVAGYETKQFSGLSSVCVSLFFLAAGTTWDIPFNDNTQMKDLV